MSDTIRKQIIENIASYLANVRRNRAYNTDIGQNVYKAKKAQIITPAIIIWPGVEDSLREYRIDQHSMPLRVDGLKEYGEDNPSDVSELMLGDLIEIMTARAWDLTFSSGGTERPEVGDAIIGATSGATAIIESWSKSSGEWQDGDVAGTFRIRRKVGTFENENLDIGANLNLATASGAITGYTIENLLTGDLADDIIYVQGGTEEYPDQGQEAVGASASFQIIYRTQTGNPYQQIT
jgi:hypothetical protein